MSNYNNYLLTSVALHHQKQAKIEADKFRLNSSGAGCKPKLTLPDQVLLTLVYLSQMHIFQYLGIQFGVSESTANNIFHYWLDIFTELLPASLLEQVKTKDSDYELVLQLLTQYELISCSTSKLQQQRHLYFLFFAAI